MGAQPQIQSQQRGFTLIELMVVVIIVGVLAAVALPAYQDSVIKSNRSAAQAYLLELAQKQQLYFNDTRTYAASVTDLKDVPTKVARNYTLSITLSTVSPPPEFTITAAPKIGTAQVKDGPLTIDDKGEKLRAGAAW